MSKVKLAAAYLKTLGADFKLFAHKSFFHDHSEIYVIWESKLLSLSEGGQTVDREIIREGLIQVTYGGDNYAEVYYPRMHGRSQKDIALSPSRNYGRPFLNDSGLSVEAIQARFSAGESISDLSADYAVDLKCIEQALRWGIDESAAA